MWPGVERGRLDSFQGRILPVCHHLSDFRCRNDFFAAVCGCVYPFERRGFHGDVGFLVFISRGFGLGLAERGVGLEMIDTGLRSELRKQGVFTTSFEELYNWGRKNSIWPLGFGL